MIRDLGARALRGGFLWAAERGSLRKAVTTVPATHALVSRFVAGETLDEAVAGLRALHDRRFRTTVDVLGESVSDGHAAEEAAGQYVAALDALARGALDTNVSVKLTQMGLDLDPAFCLATTRRIAATAATVGGFVRIDMEDHTRTDPTLAIARQLHAETGNVGAVVQAYLRRSASDIERLITEGIRVRLCKGAYSEPADVAFQDRAEVDASYIALMERLLIDGTYPALATHDPAIIDRARSFVRAHGIDASRFEFQMLYGVRRDLQERLVRDGFTVRVYVPFGRDWYPYFMRRLAERPANVLFVVRSLLGERGSRD
ncbi:MAG: proline dehydrogenase [Chloroflexota bacterium]|nr:proline dehydrogenase [Chloroflexota bacterium]